MIIELCLELCLDIKIIFKKNLFKILVHIYDDDRRMLPRPRPKRSIVRDYALTELCTLKFV